VLRHNHHVVRFGVRRIDHGQFGGPHVLREVDRLPLADAHHRLDGLRADQQFAEHQQPDAAVQQHDACPLGEHQPAADEQHAGGSQALDELPQDPHRRVVERRFGVDEQPAEQDAQQ
jgi:hypothetical protein